MSVSDLLEQLSSLERWTRYQAKRLLFYRPSPQVIREADAWLAKRWEVADDKWLLEVIGVYEAHETVRPRLLDRLLASDDHRVRAYATRVAGKWGTRLAKPLARLRQRAGDEHPRVRLEAAVAATYVPRAESVEVVMQVWAGERDRFLDYAIGTSALALQPFGITPCATGNWILPATPSARIFCESCAARCRKGRRRGSNSTTWPAWPVINRRGKACPGCTRRWPGASG